jgi:hypothetical protein
MQTKSEAQMVASNIVVRGDTRARYRRETGKTADDRHSSRQD